MTDSFAVDEARHQRKAGLLLAAIAATLVMSLCAAIGPITLFWTNETRVERNLVEQHLDLVRNVQSLLVDAETGQRGYVLTGKDVFLQPYHIASSMIRPALTRLRQAYAGSPPEDIAKVEELIQHAEMKMSHLAMVVRLRSESGFEAGAAEITSGRGKQLMDSVRDISADLVATEIQHVALLERKLERNLRWAVFLSAITFLVTLGLGRFMYLSMRKTVQRQAELARQQNESAAAAVAATTQLSQSLVDLEQRNREIGLLAELAQLLQTELSQEEALQLASTYCKRLLRTSSGTFYLYRNSADALQPAAFWGHSQGSPDADFALLSPQDCWAIRRGRRHVVEENHDIACRHYASEFETGATANWCLPLIAYGEVLGLLYIRFPGPGAAPDASLQCAEAVAEQTALALANSSMRQVLQSQSIKDPLTGLYNRRFMEETLERELARAKRSHSALSVVMVDLDNFKALNDHHGHPAGDAVLQTCSALLQRSLRASDIACRFGGEELMVILPDCSTEDAVIKADTIRASFEAMTYGEIDGLLRVTASFGVACTTQCGFDKSVLLKSADAALYSAKRGGKNRVERWLLPSAEERSA